MNQLWMRMELRVAIQFPEARVFYKTMKFSECTTFTLQALVFHLIVNKKKYIHQCNFLSISSQCLYSVISFSFSTVIKTHNILKCAVKNTMYKPLPLWMTSNTCDVYFGNLHHLYTLLHQQFFWHH